MEAIITPEEATEIGLNEDQLKALEPILNDKVANLKKGFSGEANKNAEAIISGAAEAALKKFGLDIKRNDGEKNADFLQRVNEAVFENERQSVSTLKAEYEKKLKEFDGGDATKKELEDAKAKLDEAKRQLAEMEGYKEKAEKFDPLASEYETLRQSVAYQSVKPSFPDTVNPYEAKAKWEQFVKQTNEKYSVVLVEGEAIAIDKDNEHRRVKLEELLKQDKDVTELLQGRQQRGTGAKPTKSFEGLPFELPENPTSEDISRVINEYLAKNNVPKTSPQFGSKFKEMHDKVHAAINKQ